MRLVRYLSEGEPVTGIAVDDRVVAVAALGASDDVAALLAAGPNEWKRLDQAARAHDVNAPLKETHLLAPIARPPKFVGIGMNFEDHMRDAMSAPRTPEVLEVLRKMKHIMEAWQTPPFPVLFNKQTSCITGPHDDVWLPSDSAFLDYEGELVAVIGRRLRRAEPEQAQAAIAGYTITNDLSVRDWQWETQQTWMGKSFETHGPLGPCIVTADEFDPSQATLRTWVGDELRQDGRIADQMLSPAEVVASISQRCTLEPGDLVAMGTPAGTASATGTYLVAGEVVRVEIHGIGEISNRVIVEPPDDL